MLVSSYSWEVARDRSPVRFLDALARARAEVAGYRNPSYMVSVCVSGLEIARARPVVDARELSYWSVYLVVYSELLS